MAPLHLQLNNSWSMAAKDCHNIIQTNHRQKKTLWSSHFFLGNCMEWDEEVSLSHPKEPQASVRSCPREQKQPRRRTDGLLELFRKGAVRVGTMDLISHNQSLLLSQGWKIARWSDLMGMCGMQLSRIGDSAAAINISYQQIVAGILQSHSLHRW